MSNIPATETILNRIDSFSKNRSLEAVIESGGRRATYEDLKLFIDRWLHQLKEDGIKSGSVVAFEGDFGINSTSLIFALIQIRAVLVPFTKDVSAEVAQLSQVAGVQYSYTLAEDWGGTLVKSSGAMTPPLVQEFLTRGHAGLIVFTSGSTGKPKGILHDVESLMEKFVTPRKGWRAVLFLLMDHFGGFNTFLSIFANGGCAICLKSRTPSAVAKAISEYKATLLPTTPTFLNMIIMSGLHKHFDLSSLELVTYGTEPMQETTLLRVREALPHVQLKQTYGLSEQGVLHSKSESDESLWIKIGGKGFETKVIDNILYLRSSSNMVGYLNAPSPFDDEGWFCTGDEVEVKGEYIRFLGRKSEVINVGGKKVYPLEVESVLLKAQNVQDVTVFPSKHPLMGQVVHARVALKDFEDEALAVERLRKHCNEQMAKYKIPIKFEITSKDHFNQRYKKVRRESVHQI